MVRFTTHFYAIQCITEFSMCNLLVHLLPVQFDDTCIVFSLYLAS